MQYLNKDCIDNIISGDGEGDLLNIIRISLVADLIIAVHSLYGPTTTVIEIATRKNIAKQL